MLSVRMRGMAFQQILYVLVVSIVLVCRFLAAHQHTKGLLVSIVDK